MVLERTVRRSHNEGAPVQLGTAILSRVVSLSRVFVIVNNAYAHLLPFPCHPMLHHAPESASPPPSNPTHPHGPMIHDGTTNSLQRAMPRPQVPRPKKQDAECKNLPCCVAPARRLCHPRKERNRPPRRRKTPIAQQNPPPHRQYACPSSSIASASAAPKYVGWKRRASLSSSPAPACVKLPGRVSRAAGTTV